MYVPLHIHLDRPQPWMTAWVGIFLNEPSKDFFPVKPEYKLLIYFYQTGYQTGEAKANKGE